MNESKKLDDINEIYVFIYLDKNGLETVEHLTFMKGDPKFGLISTDHERIDRLIRIAENLSKTGNNTVKLVKYSNREDIKVFEVKKDD